MDLTPLSPGGENGGSRVVALTLISQLSALLPATQLVLLTSRLTHHELAPLDGPNVRRLLLPLPALSVRPDVGQEGQAPPPGGAKAGLPLRRYLPARMAYQGSGLYAVVRRRLLQPLVVRDVAMDLIYCPFTVPFYTGRHIPLVATVHDLQYHDLPDFLSERQRFHQHQHLVQAASAASALVCVSDFTRDALVRAIPSTRERVQTIHLGVLASLAANEPAAVLARLELRRENYLLYPANFWGHKNHAMLLTAFGIYRARHPDSEVCLVCTGVPNERMRLLQGAAAGMGLKESVRFPGFLSRSDLAALLQGCRAVIVPSLYEGFGMPVLEGLSLGKPVACSNVSSLPEVAGDSALLFNPRLPYEMADAIARILHADDLRASLSAGGPARAAAFGDAQVMASQYCTLFQDLCLRSRPARRSRSTRTGRDA